MIVYLDVLLIENFLINFFLITVVMQLTGYKFKYRLVGLASILGSLYTMTVFFEQLKIFTNLIFKILVVFIMIKIVLRNKNIISVIKTSGIFFLVSILFSGFCLVFAIVENPYNIQGAFTIRNYSSKNLLFSSMILYLIIYRSYLYFKNRAIINNFIYDLEFFIKGKNFKVQAFLDTGNELIEPVTMLPVIILEQDIVNEINIIDEDIFYIPYKVIGANSKLKGIRVENIKLKNRDKGEKCIDVIMAFCNTNLSSDGDFNALLPRAVL